MTIPYLVRKKADLSSGKRKEQWYAVQKKLQERGGVDLTKLAELLSAQPFSTGDDYGYPVGIGRYD